MRRIAHLGRHGGATSRYSCFIASTSNQHLSDDDEAQHVILLIKGCRHALSEKVRRKVRSW